MPPTRKNARSPYCARLPGCFFTPPSCALRCQDGDVTWASRTERSAGKTSPEELLSAAHASCYCMALSHELSEAGNEPEHLEATATLGFVPGEGVKYSRIAIRGR